MTSFLRFGIKTMPEQVRISRPQQPWAIKPGIVYMSTLSAFCRLISRRVIPAAMFAFAANSASPADFDTGFAAYDRGEQAVAVQEFQGLANEGHAGTQYQLGRMFSKGQVVTKDNRKAAKWYKLAAEQGIVRAQVELGQMFETGRGVSRDSNAAASWFMRAARHGNAEAQVKKGYMYAEGEGMPRDLVKAVVWISPVDLRDDFKADESLEKIKTFLTENQMAEARDVSRRLAIRILEVDVNKLRRLRKRQMHEYSGSHVANSRFQNLAGGLGL